jgi:hypothetical protein
VLDRKKKLQSAIQKYLKKGSLGDLSGRSLTDQMISDRLLNQATQITSKRSQPIHTGQVSPQINVQVKPIRKNCSNKKEASVPPNKNFRSKSSRQPEAARDKSNLRQSSDSQKRDRKQ